MIKCPFCHISHSQRLKVYSRGLKETRALGRMAGWLNFISTSLTLLDMTFLMLLLNLGMKVDSLVHLMQFSSPLSLNVTNLLPLQTSDLSPFCNLVYKVFSKLAAIRIKPILDRAISRNQFGFLHNR